MELCRFYRLEETFQQAQKLDNNRKTHAARSIATPCSMGSASITGHCARTLRAPSMVNQWAHLRDIGKRVDPRRGDKSEK
ncbi:MULTISPECIES: hypothetical protein [unclassified Pseudomonas]|uniref:hypothetical protein n=1 Tax=unclassified Pseudomonas TaxID=196821 RepID=UPI002AC90798|nr:MULTISPECIES: hypothetical protein [unclassified Pseudomonas]MEB0043859.1 hypothetical protein [Pseudomonas sp. Dout3]MEB0095203.1 hypothetical protein [Pseudomonas sp. DC1.2]WPX58761.1 hypothetical protein RHM68_24820 [Pseudomonas sp. DC1.2]